MVLKQHVHVCMYIMHYNLTTTCPVEIETMPNLQGLKAKGIMRPTQIQMQPDGE